MSPRHNCEKIELLVSIFGVYWFVDESDREPTVPTFEAERYVHTTRERAWEVKERSGGALIHLRYDYEMKYGPVGAVLAALMRPVFARACQKMLDSYERGIDA